jgi:hypothetical protein
VEWLKLKEFLIFWHQEPVSDHSKDSDLLYSSLPNDHWSVSQSNKSEIFPGILEIFSLYIIHTPETTFDMMVEGLRTALTDQETSVFWDNLKRISSRDSWKFISKAW